MNKRRRWKAKARRKHGPAKPPISIIADIVAMIRMMETEKLCQHNAVTKSVEDGLVRLSCAECGFTMFMSEELEASL